MKYLVFIGLFVAGLAIGYFVGIRNSTDNMSELTAETEYITQFVHDTIVEKERVEVPVYLKVDEVEDSSDVIINDPLEVDTLTELTKTDSIIPQTDIVIRRDEMISSVIMPIQFLETEVDKDTLIKDLLGIKETIVKEMLAEFWESPLGFSGYKLSKNKLVLYGLSAQFDYSIYKENKVYYLTDGNSYYKLTETQEFMPYKQVEKPEILND